MRWSTTKSGPGVTPDAKVSTRAAVTGPRSDNDRPEAGARLKGEGIPNVANAIALAIDHRMMKALARSRLSYAV